ncbi:MAG TPA: type II secretion system protein [Gemmatimonadales bacterium]|nr:type II secretion system protein [Gemmatimonadales bacterium]
MHHLGGRAFALVELLIALVLLGTVAAVTYQIMTTGQRVYHAQTQRIDLQQSLRAAAAVLPAELRVLDARDGDILAMASDSITIRAMRLFAVACDTPTLDGGAITGRTVVIRNSLTFGSRMLTAGDSVLVYYEGRPGSRNDDGWLRGRLTLDPVSARCAGPEPIAQALPGMRLTVDLAPLEPPQQNRAGMVPLGAPVWGYETTTYKEYRSPSDGLWYLGQRAAGATLQPLLGPLAGPKGLTFAYFDSTGVETATAPNVAQIEIAVRGRTAEPTRMADGRQADGVDSLVMRVALRNNRRF